jgi:hypothetical protein
MTGVEHKTPSEAPGILHPVARRRYVSPKRERFPWLLLLVLVGAVYFFWFSPRHRRPPPVQVEYAQKK